MRAGRTLVVAAGTALALAAAGCQSIIARGDLPEAPIALLYMDEKTARERADSLAQAIGVPKEKKSQTQNRAVARPENLQSYLDRLLGVRRGGDAAEQGRLALYFPRTGEVETIVEARAGAIPMQWSQDHRRLLFSQIVRTHPQLFELDRDTQVVRAVTRGPMAHPEGCWGPEGSVVYTEVDIRNRAPNASIWLKEPAGEPRRLSRPLEYASYPACARDGSAIAWTTRVGLRRENVTSLVPVRDGDPRDLGPGREPFFSPDGAWVVYVVPVGRKTELARVRPDGTGRVRLGSSTVDEMRPTVSPDGRLIAYVAELENRQRLYLRRFDGTGDRILFSNGGSERPVW